MKRFTLILSGVLAFQLVLAFALTFAGSNYGAFKADAPLLTFDKAKVDQIAIDETGGNSVTLKKEDGKWIVPSMAGFPANQDLVNGLLTKLADMKKGWPVATTSDAAERFKLTDKSHERRIVLKNGDKQLAGLMIGSSNTYRQAHVRADDDNDIYSAAIASYDAGARGEEWMNRQFLEIPQDKIASISVGDIVLDQKDGKFTLAGLNPDQQAKEADVRQLANTISNPSFDVVEGKGKDALAKLEPADFQVMVKPKEGDPITYKFKKEASGKAYLFSSSAHDYVFRVAESTIDPIVKAKRETLIEAKEAEKKTDEAPKVSGEHATSPGG